MWRIADYQSHGSPAASNLQMTYINESIFKVRRWVYPSDCTYLCSTEEQVMLIKSTLLFVIAVFIGLTVSPTYSGNIISCDSFETCPDGETSSAIITEL
jgi:hypothetical protein